MQTIKILVKNVYGNQHAYPDCEKGKLITQLTGKKTFSTYDLQVMQKLGFKIEFNNPVNTIEQLMGAV